MSAGFLKEAYQKLGLECLHSKGDEAVFEIDRTKHGLFMRNVRVPVQDLQLAWQQICVWVQSRRCHAADCCSIRGDRPSVVTHNVQIHKCKLRIDFAQN